VHGEVGDRDLRGVRAEDRGELLVEIRDVGGAGRASRGAQVERIDGGGLRIRGEQDVSGAERQDAEGRGRGAGIGAGDDGPGGRRAGERGREAGREQQSAE
jgi:hypothetical protein